MPITDILERNCRLYGDDICLVEINPEVRDTRRVTWKEYELIEPAPRSPGTYSMKKPTALPTCCSAAAWAKGTKWPSC